MSKTIPFTLITPTAVAFEGEASLVIATGTEGEIGILASHAPFLTALKPGVLRADVSQGGVERRLVMAVSSGFLQALPDKITMLVDMALEPAAIDVDAARTDLHAAQERQRVAGDDRIAAAREQEAIDFANARLLAVN